MRERLQYVQLNPDAISKLCLRDKKTKELIIQLDGGGAAISFRIGDDAQLVVFRLRQLADQLERGVVSRVKAAGDSHERD